MDTATINAILLGLVAVGIALLIVRRQIRRSRMSAPQVGDVYRASSAMPRAPQPTIVEEPPQLEVQQKTEAEILSEMRAELASAETPEESWDVFDSSDSGSQIEQEAADKAIKLSREEFASAEDIDRCWEIIDLLREKDFGESAIVVDEGIERIFVLSTTLDEALAIVTELNDRWNDGIEEELARAFRLAISLASDYDEAESVFSATEEDSEIELEAYKRMLGFAEDVETCESLWDEKGTDTDLGELAILRAAEIIKAKDDSAPE